MTSTFRHGLKIRLKPNYFQQEFALGEEDQVCHDIIKCCNEMDARGYWTSALASSINGQLQTFLRQSMRDLAREKAWHQLDARLKETMSLVLPLAVRALKENTILDLSDFKDLVQIGTSRLLHSKGLMVHVWRNPKCAGNFGNGINRLWQAIFDHRIEGIHAPYTCMFCIQSTYVSVTALPPVMLNEYPPVFLPPPEGCGDSLLAYMAKQLSNALLLEEGVALPMCYSRDGRYYVLSLRELLSAKLPGLRGQCVRYELMLAHAFDQSTMIYAEYVKHVAIPNVVTYLAEQAMRPRSDEDRKINSLVRDKVLRNAMHKFGVNICLLYQVLVFVDGRIQQLQADPETAALYHIIASMIRVEMVGRVLKQFVRSDFHMHDAEGKYTEDERLEAVNRLAQFTAAKNPDFWNDQMLPGLRRKFYAPDSFVITHTQAVPPAALKIMTSKVGCEFSPETQRFARFVPVSTVSSLFIAMVIPKSNDKESEVSRFWEEASKFAVDSPRHRTFVARAIVRSALLKSGQTGAAREIAARWAAIADTDGGGSTGGATSKEPMLEKLRLAALVTEYCATDADVASQLQLLRDYKPAERIDAERNASIKSMQFLRLVLLRLTDDPPASLAPAEEALDVFHEMRWADFTYNDIFDQSLQVMEAEAPNLTPTQLGELHHLARAVKARYDGVGKRPYGIRYVQRLLKALLAADKSWAMPETRRLAIESVDDNHAVFGVESWRAMLSVYYMAFYASCAARDTDRAKATLKLIEIVHGQDTERHRGIASGGPALELMLRTHKELAGRDDDTSQRVLAFVHYFGEWYLSMLLAQRIGRGYLDRLKVCNWLEIMRRKLLGDAYNPWVPRLTRFFKKYAPARVVEVEGLLKLHKGKERELLRQLEREYGVAEPDPDERIPRDHAKFNLRHAIKPEEVGAAEAAGSRVDPAKLSANAAASAATPGSGGDGFDPVLGEGGGGINMDDIIRDIFNVCDTDRDGRVTANECYELLSAMAIMEPQVLRQLFVETFGARKLSFVQFRELVLTGRLTDDNLSIQ